MWPFTKEKNDNDDVLLLCFLSLLNLLSLNKVYILIKLTNLLQKILKDSYNSILIEIEDYPFGQEFDSYDFSLKLETTYQIPNFWDVQCKTLTGPRWIAQKLKITSLISFCSKSLQPTSIIKYK